MTYATRRLQPGDAFDAVVRDARILKAIGKARDDYDAPVKEALAASVAVPTAAAPAADAPASSTPSAPTALPAAPALDLPVSYPTADPIEALRAEAETFGLHVDRRWGEARLAQEIEDAREKQAAQEAATAAAKSPIAMTTESAPALVPPWRQSDEE